jgi:hypothetical protein
LFPEALGLISENGCRDGHPSGEAGPTSSASIPFAALPLEIWIEHRIPADALREDFFVNQVLEANGSDGEVLVLLGDMHVMPVAEKLRSMGHTVDVRHELVPVKRWE